MTEIAAEALEARRFAGMPGLTGLRRRYARFIAIVDDDASMRVALTRLLRVHGIKSRSYSSARAFLTALPSAMPDCLIVDVNMPEMTGLDLQRELLKLGVHVPTVVITAVEDESIAADAKSLGAEAFLTKPINNESLMAAINSAVCDTSRSVHSVFG